jgi:hypothetical protein
VIGVAIFLMLLGIIFVLGALPVLFRNPILGLLGGGVGAAMIAMAIGLLGTH